MGSLIGTCVLHQQDWNKAPIYGNLGEYRLMRFIVIALIDTNQVNTFFTSHPNERVLGFEDMSRICMIGQNTAALASIIEEKLDKNEVVSQLFRNEGQKTAQSRTLCNCQLRDIPRIFLRTAQGPVEFDPYLVNQRLSGLLERARLQKDNSAQEGLTLAAKLEVETDRLTNCSYVLLPNVDQIFVTFTLSRSRGNSELQEVTATITLQRNRVLEYDFSTLSVSTFGPQGFKRKMISAEIAFLVDQYTRSLDWATKAIAHKN